MMLTEIALTAHHTVVPMLKVDTWQDPSHGSLLVLEVEDATHAILVVATLLPQVDAVLSIACGIGIQTMNEQYPGTLTLPGLNTTFLGQPTEQGVWEERCQACGDCVLGTTGGICPIARCAKSLLNGPCGGSQNSVCEVDPDTPCAWQLIYDRMTALGQLDLLLEPNDMKDWRSSRDGGTRKIVREDLRLEE